MCKISCLPGWGMSVTETSVTRMWEAAEEAQGEIPEPLPWSHVLRCVCSWVLQGALTFPWRWWGKGGAPLSSEEVTNSKLLPSYRWQQGWIMQPPGTHAHAPCSYNTAQGSCVSTHDACMPWGFLTSICAVGCLAQGRYFLTLILQRSQR